MRRFLMLLPALCLLALSLPIQAEAAAEAWYTNPDTGYFIILEDDASLLAEYQLEGLAGIMEPITRYGNAAFKTINANSQTTARYAELYYYRVFGRDSGVLFLIDMDNRNIWIWSNGAVYDVVTQGYADIITDNCYRYASRQEYYLCAKRAFTEIISLLDGQRIAQPMKYISNALLALILAFLINYVIVRYTQGGSDKEIILEGTQQKYQLTNPRIRYLTTTRQRIEPDSRGGGGGGLGGGGGGGLGGGGGHGF